VLNAASYHSHPSSVLALSLFAYCVTRGAPQKKLGWAALSGLALGYTFLVRPVDAAVFAAAMIVFFRTPRFVAACAACATTGLWATLAYQRAQFGSALRTGYEAYEPALRATYGHMDAAVSPRYLLDPLVWWDHTKWLVELGWWLAPGLVALVVVGAWTRPRADALQRLFFAFCVAIALLVPFLAISYGEGYGPRYLLPLFVPFTVLAAGGHARLLEWGEKIGGAAAASRAARAAVLAAVALGLARSGYLVERSGEDIDLRASLYRQAAARGIHRAVVIVDAQYPTRFTRNDPGFDGDVLYVQEKGRGAAEIAALFEDRTTYVATERPGGGAWTFSRVTAAGGASP
jgi:hypothetical protein